LSSMKVSQGVLTTAFVQSLSYESQIVVIIKTQPPKRIKREKIIIKCEGQLNEQAKLTVRGTKWEERMKSPAHATKVVVERQYLQGAKDNDLLQKIAAVYLDQDEFRVYAPPLAIGDPLEWRDHWTVQTPSFGNPFPARHFSDAQIYLVKVAAEEELKRKKTLMKATKEPALFYHVRIFLKGKSKAEAKFDIEAEWLDDRILKPYSTLQPIVLGGKTIPIGEIDRVEIYRSREPSSTFTDLTASLARSGSKDWHLAEGNVEDVTDEMIMTPLVERAPSDLDAISLICQRFHLVVRQLRVRHDNRATLDVEDEYDVQDLLHSLLRLFLDDIRTETWTPDYAGKNSRMDFLVPSVKTIIETKKTRKGLSGGKLGDELLIDIARYKPYPSVDQLMCLVYDPDGYIGNPRGIETDLSKSHDGLDVKVLIIP
jgi:hypothetical protein